MSFVDPVAGFYPSLQLFPDPELMCGSHNDIVRAIDHVTIPGAIDRHDTGRSFFRQGMYVPGEVGQMKMKSDEMIRSHEQVIAHYPDRVYSEIFDTGHMQRDIPELIRIEPVYSLSQG